MSATAVEAALTVAREQGVRCDDPMVLREAWHVLVHLGRRPLSLASRASFRFPEGPNPDDIARELAVATHCARAGCAVVPPADEVEPVPYSHGGHLVTFGRYIEPHDEPDEAAALRALHKIHDALESYEDGLPAFGHPKDTAAMLDGLPPSSDVEFLREVTARRCEVVGQPLHGDAHLYNVLGTPRGPRRPELAGTVHRRLGQLRDVLA
jgi:hypothetical protein